MVKNHKILVFCLMLAALFTSSARAVTIFVNPGNPGSSAQDFNFSDPDSALLIDIVWTDNKTLTWDAGTHVFSIFGDPGSLGYVGGLLDASGNVIPSTALAGETTSTTDFGFGAINLSDTTVFSGIRLTTTWTQSFALQWNWRDDGRPLVGVVPVPAAAWLFGSGLLGLIGIARRKRAA